VANEDGETGGTQVSAPQHVVLGGQRAQRSVAGGRRAPAVTPAEAGPQELAQLFERAHDLAPVRVQMQQGAIGVGERGQQVASLGLEADPLRERKVGRHTDWHQCSTKEG